MNELSSLAKFIYNTAITDASYTSALGTRFREELLPEGTKLTVPIGMFVTKDHEDYVGAYGNRLYTKGIYQIKVVCSGTDFSLLEAGANAIDTVFDWQNQIDTAAGRPRSQEIWIDPDNADVQLVIMSMIRLKPIKYSNYVDSVNYLHQGGEYEICFYQNGAFGQKQVVYDVDGGVFTNVP